MITLCVTYVIKTRTKATNVHCVTTSKETKEWCSVTLVADGSILFVTTLQMTFTGNWKEIAVLSMCANFVEKK